MRDAPVFRHRAKRLRHEVTGRAFEMGEDLFRRDRVHARTAVAGYEPDDGRLHSSGRIRDLGEVESGVCLASCHSTFSRFAQPGPAGRRPPLSHSDPRGAHERLARAGHPASPGLALAERRREDLVESDQRPEARRLGFPRPAGRLPPFCLLTIP